MFYFKILYLNVSKTPIIAHKINFFLSTDQYTYKETEDNQNYMHQ